MQPIGIRVRFNDPDHPGQVVTAQFATIYSHPEMKAILEDCAALDVDENIAVRRQLIAARAVDAAATEEELASASAVYRDAVRAREDASAALVARTRDFIETGFRLAGCTPELVEYLSSCVCLEDLADLKAKTMFGAGILDFTQREGLI